MESLFTVTEEFQLLTAAGGLRNEAISFKTITLEGEHHVCVRDVQPDGQTSLVIVDLEKRQSMRNNIRDAETAIMNPSERILALRSGRNLQIFDVAASKRISAVMFHDDVVYWHWITNRVIGVVTATTVYHWSMDAAPNSQPQRVFDRGVSYGGEVQILSYRVDEAQKWHVLTGVTRDAAGNMVGKALLFSVENNSSRVIDGHACCFISTPTPTESRKCNIMCMSWVDPDKGGQLMIMELPTGDKMDLTIRRNIYPLGLVDKDFTVAMHVSERHKLLMGVSSRGKAFIMDIFTGTMLWEGAVTAAMVFCGVAESKSGGLLCVNNRGTVLRVGFLDRGMVSYIRNTLHNPQLALRVAVSANLGGVDDLMRGQLDSALRMGNVEEAVQICLRAPGESLRTQEVLSRFAHLPQQPGQTPAMSTYFKMVLAEAQLNSVESIELARAVVPRGGIAYVRQQYDARKLTVSEELGDLVQREDPELALKMYHEAKSHAKVISALLQRNETQKAVQYCKTVDYSPNWKVILNDLIRAKPQDAVSLALMLYRDMGPEPVISADETVDMFVTNQKIQQATEFLLDILQNKNDESTAMLQTKLLEINLKFSPPSVADKIFARKICQFYDGMKLAPLCERAGLYQRAIECYVMAQKQDPSVRNIDNIRRCLKQSQSFSPDWLLEFFGQLNKEDSFKCLEDLCENNRQNFKVIVQIATKYSDALGAKSLIDLFLDHNLYDVLYYYLGAIVPYTRDPEIHFRYIEAAAEMGQMQELERMTRESPCYDPERTKSYLRNKKLTDMWPFINVCDKHNMISEMVHYLVETGNESYIEQYVTRRSPGKTPEVVGALIECNVSEDFIRNMLSAVGTMCPIKELVEQVESHGRLHLIKEWLEERRAEKKTDPALYNALAKVYIDIGHNPERFLLENENYDTKVIGMYCESRDPNLAYIAYAKGHNSQEVIELCQRNGMNKPLARYLVRAKSLELWQQVLADDTDHRRQLIEAVQQSALPESESSEEVSVAVRAFMNANLTEELTSLLEQIVVHGRFRKNRFLENLLIMSAIRARKDKVMEYIAGLENYDAREIANIAVGAGMYDAAFTVYDTHTMQKDASVVLLRDLKDFPRARSYAQKIDSPEVWSVLGEHLVKAGEVHEGIESLIRAKNGDFVAEVTAAADRTNQYGDLIKYLSMARRYSKAKDSKIDTALVLTYAKTGRLSDLEEFLKETHNVNINAIGDKCFSDKLYDSARVLYTVSNNYSKLALTQIELHNLPAAIDAANKTKSIETYKAVNLACIEANEMKLAGVSAVPVLLKAEEMNGMCNRYEARGLWEELLTVLRTAASNQGAHMGIFTEIGNLLAKYNPDKLLEHINMYSKRINTHKLITVCEQYHHWLALRVLHVNNEDWYAAATAVMQHYADAWDHEIFKDIVEHLGAGDVVYHAVGFYIQTHPELLGDYLSSVQKRVDPERVMTEVRKLVPMAFIRGYLESNQNRNLKKVNEALHELFIEEQNFAALRHSVETYDNFNSEELSQRLEKMELFEFRKIALLLHRKNKRYNYAINVALKNALYQDAIYTAAESGDAALVDNLLDFFVKDYPEYFVAALYTCYDLIRPDVVVQKAWLHQRLDIIMPYLIQSMQEYTGKVQRIERSMLDAQHAAKDAARRAGPAHGGANNMPLMIDQGHGAGNGSGVMPSAAMGGAHAPGAAFHPQGFGAGPVQFSSGRPF